MFAGSVVGITLFVVRFDNPTLAARAGTGYDSAHVDAPQDHLHTEPPSGP